MMISYISWFISMLDNTLLIEQPSSLFGKLSFLKLKKIWIPFVLLLQIIFWMILNLKALLPFILFDVWIIVFLFNKLIFGISSLTENIPFLKLKKIWIPFLLFIEIYFILNNYVINIILFSICIVGNLLVILFIFNFSLIVQKFSFLKQKKVWIPLVIILWIMSYYGMSYYENTNNCELIRNNEPPFIQCYFRSASWGCLPGELCYFAN